MSYKIFFSNIGYAKGIDGSLLQHVTRMGRHFYTSLPIQEQVLGQLKSIIDKEKPDLCCLVEVDQGSTHSARYNQIESLIDEAYPFHEISCKYGPGSRLGRAPLHRGKSNAFLAKKKTEFDRLYFTHGSKRLVYHILGPDSVHIFFAHFSLRRDVRIRQFAEIETLVSTADGEVMILADFNTLRGLGEIDPLLKNTGLQLMNDASQHTFTFHKHQMVLDLCLCSPGLVKRSKVKVIPQPFSDHAALLVDVEMQ